MSLIPMNVEQLRRQGMKSAEQKREQEKQYQQKIDQMSKHNVGGLYDVRAIMKSKQYKEQKNFYDVHQSEEEFRDMFQSYGMFGQADKWLDYLKKTRGQNAIDSFQLRELGKKLSDTFENFKQKHNIK